MAMDINELKTMLKQSTAVLIMDNGNPSFVVLDYVTYKRMLQNDEPGNGLANSSASNRTPASSGEMELLERINKDIQALKEQIAEEEKALGIDDSR